MRPAGVCVFLIGAVVAALAVLELGAQTAPEPSVVVLANVGLPAVEEGAIAEVRDTPRSFAARRRSTSAAVGRTRLGSGGYYLPGRVIVKFRESASSEERASAVAAASPTAFLATRLSYADFDLVKIDPTENPETVAAELNRSPAVKYAQPSYRMHTMFRPNNPLYLSRQWNLPLVNLEPAWDIQPQAGSAIVVAVLDTGLAYMNSTMVGTASAFTDLDGNPHPALGRVTIPFSAATQIVNAANAGRIVSPHDFIFDTDTPLDLDGHGTHVSGTIGQLTNDALFTAGVAFNVKLMPVKVICTNWDIALGVNEDVKCGDETIVQGIHWAVDHGANVMNMSFGREGPANCGTSPNQLGCAGAVEDAIRWAVCTGTPSSTCSGKGVFIAIAAGNGCEAASPTQQSPCTDANPTEVVAEIASRVSGAVSVAAVGHDAVITKADGTFGPPSSGACQATPVSPDPCHAYYSTTGTYVEVAAPGGSDNLPGNDASRGFVWQQTFDFSVTDTFDPRFGPFRAPRFDILAIVGYEGTSMATPHVAGVAAMLMQQGIKDPAAIEDALEHFAIDLGPKGRDNEFGFGLIDARAALRGLGLAK